MIAGRLVQQADFQHVVNPQQHLGLLNRFADEILRAGLERAQLVIRSGGNDKQRKVVVRFSFLERLHHLESVHAGHPKIEQDQVVAVLAVQRADLGRIRRGRDGNMAGSAQHPLEQQDIDFLIVDDQDSGVQNIGCADQCPSSLLF